MKIAPIVVLVALWMSYQAESTIALLLWLGVLALGLRDSYHLYRYYRH